MQGGISISNPLKFGYGTLGGKVLDRDTGEEMILSNWHVLVGSWYVWPGTPIYQPGRGDGGQSIHTVAHFTRHAMDQMIDAAVAKLSGLRPLVSDQYNLGPVKGPGDPILGMRVTKSGRRTAVTTGRITGIEGRQALYYNGIRRVIRHVVHIAQSPEGGPVSDRGDSGSWWLEESSRRAVGLHFAGSSLPEYGLAIAMPQVLDALNVEIATDGVGSVEEARPGRVLEPVRV
jgi:endonuclease G